MAHPARSRRPLAAPPFPFRRPDRLQPPRLLRRSCAATVLALCGSAAAQQAVHPAKAAPAAAPVAVLALGRTAPPRAELAKTHPAAALAIESGLQWLRRHQEPGGRWDADGFMAHDQEGEATDGPGNPVHDVGVTGLAVLALAREGVAPKDDPNRLALLKAAHWLKLQQQENGLLGTAASHDFIYDHAIGTLGLCAAAAATDSAEAREAAQAALGYLEHHRNPYSVWRYQPRDNDNDTSVTTWCVLANVAGLELGLDVNRNALKLAAVWLDQVTGPGGHVGYAQVGQPSSRHVGDHGKRFPVELGEAMTAAGLLCRLCLGQQPDGTPVLAAAAERLLAKPPAWKPEAGAVDECYWFLASEALRHFGGQPRQDWQQRLVEALLAGQRKDGAYGGSWDPVGPWGEDGGRIYATALSVLSLQGLYALPAK
jgi:hypothetical protein